MRQSDLDKSVGKTEFKLLKDQKHVDEVWSMMLPVVNQYTDGFLEGISHAGNMPSPQANYALFLQKLIADNEKLHDLYHDIFDLDAMEEYGEDPQSFKGDVLRKQCPVIYNTLNSRAEALKEWKSKFYACKSQVLYDTFNNLILFGADYDEEMDEQAMSSLDTVKDCRLADMEEDACYKSGVLGFGIAANILNHMYPRTFPGSYKAGVWSLYFLAKGSKELMPSGTSEFSMLKDETGSKTGIYEMEHNYFLPYEVFCIYALRIYRLLAGRIEARFGREFPSEYRFLLTNSFFDYVSSENSANIATLAGNDDVLKFGTPW